jgi:hypothetical protein
MHRRHEIRAALTATCVNQSARGALCRADPLAAGDMAARPNWGINELDFIFSTLIVGLIMNFSIMCVKRR